MRRSFFAFLFAISPLPCLCSGCTPASRIIEMDPKQPVSEWSRDTGGVHDEGKLLDRTRWRRVAISKELEAEAMLGGSTFVSLTDNQVTELVGSPVNVEGFRPFLLRGIESPSGNAEMDVAVSDVGIVTVLGGALAHSTVQVRRQSVVAWLGFTPWRAYARFMLAE